MTEKPHRLDVVAILLMVGLCLSALGLLVGLAMIFADRASQQAGAQLAIACVASGLSCFVNLMVVSTLISMDRKMDAVLRQD